MSDIGAKIEARLTTALHRAEQARRSGQWMVIQIRIGEEVWDYLQEEGIFSSSRRFADHLWGYPVIVDRDATPTHIEIRAIETIF